jgi:hypothetical protein
MRRRELDGGRYLRRAGADRSDRSRCERRDAVDQHRHHFDERHEPRERERIVALRGARRLCFPRRGVCLLRWLGILGQLRLGWRECIGRWRHLRRERNDDLRLRLEQWRRRTRFSVLPAESGRLLAGLRPGNGQLASEQLERVDPSAALEPDPHPQGTRSPSES